ncbi:MAG: UDP-N-acetylglucosamine--N-acetylmuramyl-(pentapeptide) pyrophosphoryl-undecaprenol N-acetylglucosamine transferase [Treponema sp.]|nr:UDP-N-acetylglucosamine--N-acetylmuramyl-(pentapeptide) pyrophosphoryl-undecaprenol N-acetylglucosamine transferase [Treponema sp.]
MRIVCTGGGSGGHIYPGIAVADELRALCAAKNTDCELFWIGNKSGIDKQIVEKNLVSAGGSINAFYGIPCGKLRRYLSLKNIADFFRFIAGIFKSFFLLKKLKPDCVFSKGGFVSVPPCLAARILHIPYYTHECDCTPGLATRLNSKGARNVFVSYDQTVTFFSKEIASRCVVTGNPVRPVFYSDNAAAGKSFLSLPSKTEKPVLLVMGGSLGARQLNTLVVNNLDWLTERFIVVHQTGAAFAKENPDLMSRTSDSYKPYDFIYAEMPSVIQAADVILSRSGANSLWECAVCAKPMLLIPLCGSGTRGDQVDNARYFADKNAALALVGDEADDEHLRSQLEKLTDASVRESLSRSCKELCQSLSKQGRPAQTIAQLIADGGKK